MKDKELFARINREAQKNIERASGMIEALNMIRGTEFFLLNKRVCFERYENGIKTFHDAYTMAE